MLAALGQVLVQQGFAALIAHSPDCIKIIDHDGNLVDMSPNGQAAMEVTDIASFIGLKWHDLWPISTRPLVIKALEEARHGQHASFRGFCPTAAGSPRWWQVDVSPLGEDLNNPTHFLAVSRDISHLYAEEGQTETLRVMVAELSAERERLLAAKVDAEHAGRLRLLGQFASSIVHDLNNVLAAMQSASTLLRRRIDGGVGADILNHVDQAVSYGSQLTRQLLDLSRRDDGSTEVLHIGEILERDADLLRHLVGKSIELNFLQGDDVPPVLASSSRIRSVVFNLVANGRDAIGGEGAITITLGKRSLHRAHKRLQPGEYVELAIADNGCGMSSEVLAKVGQAFFTTKGEGKGTGLGLASAFELAELCDGSVEIESEVGNGTVVRLMLAASPAHDDTFIADQRFSSVKRGDATILLVEDSDALRQHLVQHLKDNGYTVLEAVSAKAAVALAIGSASVDLLLSDLQLDQGTGVEVARELRERYPHLAMIFMSGSLGEEAPSNEAFIQKPVALDVLDQIIAEQLGRLPGRRLSPAQLARASRVVRRVQSKDLLDCYEEWQGLCQALGRLPSRNEFTGLKSNVERAGYIVEVGGTPAVPIFKFSEASAMVEKRLGRPLLDTYITAGDEQSLGSVSDALNRCLKGVAFHDYLALTGRGASKSFERVMLPLSDDNWSVTHIAGITKFSEDAN